MSQHYHKNSKGVAVENDVVRGRIIRDTAFFDFQISILLSMYFGIDERSMQFYSLIGQKLSLSRKVEILGEICEDAKLKSAEVTAFIKILIKIRNYLAHQHFYDDRHKIFRDNSVVKVLDDWPSNYNIQYALAKSRLQRIGKTKMFGKFHTPNYPHWKRPA
jgi:hypothetical protein